MYVCSDVPVCAFHVSEPFVIANGYGFFRRYVCMYIVMCLLWLLLIQVCSATGYL
jgi:hypothetical protein